MFKPFKRFPNSGFRGFGVYTSSYLINYITSSGNLIYRSDKNGDIIIHNNGTFRGNLLLNSGKGIELTTETVNIPIHHTLGADNSTNWGLVYEGIGGNFMTKVDNVATIEHYEATISDRPVFQSLFSGATAVDKNIFRATIEITSGTAYIKDLFGANESQTSKSTPIEQTVGVGTYVFETEELYPVIAGGGAISVRFDAVQQPTFNATVTIDRLPLSNPNSYITYQDLDTNDIVTVDNSAETPSTTYTFTDGTYNNILTHTTYWSTADRAKIEANPNLIGKLALSTTGTISELDMVLDQGATDDAYYGCMELSGDTLYDSRSSNTETMSNYVSTVRENTDFLPNGIQTTAFQRDALGVPQVYDVTALNFISDGYGDTQWNPSLESEFWIEEVVDGVIYQHKYDGTNLTTYTNNVAGSPAAHSPENADYIVGKGVYPKVAEDPYTVNVCIPPIVYTGTGYTNYNQADRYTYLYNTYIGA